MAKNELTAKKIRAMIARGEVEPSDTYRLTFSLPYATLADFLEFKETLGKSMSGMIRDAVSTFQVQKAREREPEKISQMRDVIISEQKKLKVELLASVKEMIEREGQIESPEEADQIKARMLMFLGELGPLTTKELARYVGVDWKVIDKQAVVMQGDKLVDREGSRWVIA